MARVSDVKEDGQEEYKLILYEVRPLSGCLFVCVNLSVCQPQIQHYIGPMHLILQVQFKNIYDMCFLGKYFSHWLGFLVQYYFQQISMFIHLFVHLYPVQLEGNKKLFNKQMLTSTNQKGKFERD